MITKIKKEGISYLKQIGKRVLPYLPYQIGTLLSYAPDALLTINSPILITIEPNNTCNLKCPLCPRQLMTREKGAMKIDDFKLVVNDLSDSVTKIELFFMGEPLLNKDIFDMVKYANKQNIDTLISTNSTTLDRHINDLLSCGLTELLVCLDGASKESHEKYRAGSNFGEIIKNIKILCKEKQKRKSDTIVTLQFLVMKHNEHEIPLIVKLSKQLGVDHLVFKLVHLGTLNIYQRLKMAKKYLPIDSEYRVYELKGNALSTHKKQICYWAWSSVILWNGDVTGCCYDYDGQYVVGNVFREGGFKKIYKSEKYKRLRKNILKQNLDLCEKCSYNIEGNVRIY